MCGGAKAPPYKPGQTAALPINPARGTPLPGGMYASHTNPQYRVYDTGNGCWREVYGPYACGPCEPPGNGRGTGRGTGRANVCRRLARLRPPPYCIEVTPPSTFNVTPVTNAAPSLHKNSAAAAMSRPLPSRPAGMRRTRLL